MVKDRHEANAGATAAHPGRIEPMNGEYLHRLQTILATVRPEFQAIHHWEFKPCFGAVAAYVDGRIFASCGKFGLALRLPPGTLTELFRDRDVVQLRYFPKGHVKKEYAVIPPRILDTPEHFDRLLTESIEHVLAAFAQP